MLRQILQTEESLGAALFERLAELKGLKRGHVGMALIEALGERMVLRTVAAIGEEHPHLTFDLQVQGNDLITAAMPFHYQVGASYRF